MIGPIRDSVGSILRSSPLGFGVLGSSDHFGDFGGIRVQGLGFGFWGLALKATGSGWSIRVPKTQKNVRRSTRRGKQRRLSLNPLVRSYDAWLAASCQINPCTVTTWAASEDPNSFERRIRAKQLKTNSSQRMRTLLGCICHT